MSDSAAVGEESEVQVRVLQTLTELDAVARSWHALWDRCRGVRTPALSFEWVRIWARCFAADGRLHIIIVEKNDAAIGIIPLVRNRYRIWPFALEALETAAPESRNLIALVAPGDGPIVARAAARHLAHCAISTRRALWLSLIPSEHPFLSQLADALRSETTHIALQVRSCNCAPYAPLPAVWHDFERSIGKSRRKILARSQRRLDLSRAEVSITERHGDEVPDAMSRLFRSHNARWAEAGVRGLFTDERVRAFHTAIAAECDRLGWLDMTEMQIDGVTASIQFVPVLDGVAYLMRSGRDTTFAEYDVGHLHDLHLFRKWVNAGLREVDFLRGVEPYKFYWTRRYRVYVDVLAVRPWVRGSVALWIVRRWLRVSRFLQHRHPPRELLYYLRLRRGIRGELRQMKVDLRQ